MKIIINEVDKYLGYTISSFLLHKGFNVIGITDNKENTTIFDDNFTLIEQNDLNNNNKINADTAIFTLPSKKNNLNTEIEFLHNLAQKSGVSHLIWLTTALDNFLFDETLEKAIKDLNKTCFATTILKTGFIIGSGSPSFEIIRRITEKTPILFLPKWTKTDYSMVAIDDLLEKLLIICNKKDYYNKTYFIRCPENNSFGRLCTIYARTRSLLRFKVYLPLSFSKISQYYLCLISHLKLQQAKNLVCNQKNKSIYQYIPNIETKLKFQESLCLALGFVKSCLKEKKQIDLISPSPVSFAFEGNWKTPVYGCVNLTTKKAINKRDLSKIVEKINATGKNNNLYFINWFWHFKGWANWVIKSKTAKTNWDKLNVGDKISYWKVVVADYKKMRYLLYNELLLPGEGWLEFAINNINGEYFFKPTLIFRPLGFSGHFYWFWAKPFHWFFMKRMLGKYISDQ